MTVAVKIKAEPLRVRKDACFVVCMQNMKPGPQHGQWQAISTSGFVVVCPSKLEAFELVWMAGGRHFARPSSLTDEQYLDWLLAHYFRVESYVAESRPLEVMFSEFVRGWFPNAEDILFPHGTITAERRSEPHLSYRDGLYMPLIQSALDVAWGDR